MAALDLDGIGAEAKSLGQEADHGVVGRALLWRCHHLDLQGIAQPANDLIS